MAPNMCHSGPTSFSRHRPAHRLGPQRTFESGGRVLNRRRVSAPTPARKASRGGRKVYFARASPRAAGPGAPGSARAPPRGRLRPGPPPPARPAPPRARAGRSEIGPKTPGAGVRAGSGPGPRLCPQPLAHGVRRVRTPRGAARAPRAAARARPAPRARRPAAAAERAGARPARPEPAPRAARSPPGARGGAPTPPGAAPARPLPSAASGR